LLGEQIECYSFVMNKHLGNKARAAKVGRHAAVRKALPRSKPSPGKATKRQAARSPQPASAANFVSLRVSQVSVTQVNGGKVGISQMDSPVAVIGSALRAHKFRVGQTVFYTSSPISRPGATGSYKVVRLLPSDGDDYQYRIKHAGEAFERVAKESQLELEG
jgi:hypothetical protein